MVLFGISSHEILQSNLRDNSLSAPGVLQAEAQAGKVRNKPVHRPHLQSYPEHTLVLMAGTMDAWVYNALV